VLIIVAVDTEILPVGAIRRIILGIPILVMHRQELTGFVIELSPALGANHPVYLQGALPIAIG
jgi:hypothetical protein